MSKPPHEIALELTRELMERGLIVEAGWKSLELLWLLNPTDVAREELRCAFYAGALHVYSALMTGLDAGHVETDADMKKMENLHDELTRFEATFRLKYKIPP